MPSTMSVDPIHQKDVLAVVSAIARHVDVLAWHMAQIRPGAAEEIIGGMDAIKEAIRALRAEAR